ncbi:hypothetical protein ACQ4PT_067344 [Festuca glaucescens]
MDSSSNHIGDSARKSSSTGTGTAEMNISDSARNSSGTAEMNINDALTSQFTVTLKPSHLGARQKQYLVRRRDLARSCAVPRRRCVLIEFVLIIPSLGGRDCAERAAGVPERAWVRREERGGAADARGEVERDPATRASLRYGWHQFCVDNRLGVGDVCFFRALRGDGVGDDHALKVEVRKRDGSFID